MKKKTLNIFLFLFFIFSIIGFVISLINCINAFISMFQVLTSENTGNTVKEMTINYVCQFTFFSVVFFFIALSSLFLFFKLNKTELQSLNCTVKEFIESQKENKKQKQEAEKQRKIETLEKELNDLKNNKQ